MIFITLKLRQFLLVYKEQLGSIIHTLVMIFVIKL